MAGRPRAGDSEENVAAHIRFERELRGWSTAELARHVTDAGCPISQSAVWRIESGEPRRKISVDELVAFSKVFGKSIGDLLQPPTTNYPEEAIKEYAEAWLNEEVKVWRQELDASVKFHDVLVMLATYPGAVPRLPELLAELMEKDHRGVVKEQVARRLSHLQGKVNSVRSERLKHVADTKPLIRYWRRIGMTSEEMMNEVKRRGLEGTMSGNLESDIRLSGIRFGQNMIVTEGCAVRVDEEADDGQGSGRKR